ncbi:MAG: phosphatase PAP2 family protein, partial [Candidatus Saccharicenans sp.]
YFIHGQSNLWLIPINLIIIWLVSWLPKRRQLLSKKSPAYFVFSAASLACYAYLYKLAGFLVNFLSQKWNDKTLESLDQIIFGFSPNLALAHFYRPWLSELMMLAYLAYLPLVVWLAYELFRRTGPEEMQSYILTLGLAYLTCFIIFIIFPASSPRFYFPNLPPRGGFLLERLMRLVESRAQYQGGSFPSAHCAAGTVMIYFAFRVGMETFILIAPMIVLFFISTVYGQYHYGVDVLGGMAIGIAAILIFNLIFKKKPAP